METRTYRAAGSAYLVFGTITGALAVLWIVPMWRGGEPWLPLALPLLGFLAVLLWLSRFRLTFAGEEILLCVPFQAPRRLGQREILSVEFERSEDEEPSMELHIRTSFGEELRLNARIFSTEAVQRLLALDPRPSSGRSGPAGSPAQSRR